MTTRDVRSYRRSDTAVQAVQWLGNNFDQVLALEPMAAHQPGFDRVLLPIAGGSQFQPIDLTQWIYVEEGDTRTRNNTDFTRDYEPEPAGPR